MPLVAFVLLPPKNAFLSITVTEPPFSITVCAAERPPSPPPTLGSGFGRHLLQTGEFQKRADLGDHEPQYIVNKMSKVSGKGYFMSVTQLEDVEQYKYEVGVYVGSETFRIASETVTIPVDTWMHMVATYDGMSLVLYMSEDPDSLHMVRNGTWAEDPVAFGKRNAQPLHIGESFFGLIDELKIFESVLAVNEWWRTACAPLTRAATCMTTTSWRTTASTRASATSRAISPSMTSLACTV